MQINPFAMFSAYLEEIKGTRRKGAVSGGPSPYASAPSDSVELSSRVDEVEQLSELIPVQPDVRMERVTEVTQKITSGQYHPTDREIAESVVKTTVMDHLL